MRKILFLLLFISLLCGRAQAQDSTYLDEDQQEDSTALSSDIKGDTLLNFRPMTDMRDSVNEWKRKEAFAYMSNLDSMLRTAQREQDERATRSANNSKERDGKLKRTDEEERRFILRERSSSSPNVLFNSGIFQGIMWTLAGIFIAYVLYKLFLSKGVFKKNTAVKSTEETVHEAPENIAEGDYDRLLRQAYLLGDLRMAARYLFLKTLQKLHEKELIVFSQDKTNSDYVYELPEAKRNTFSTLALYYEYIWYGNMQISKEDFNKVESKFNQFLNGL
jgi:hypothetical protein